MNERLVGPKSSPPDRRVGARLGRFGSVWPATESSAARVLGLVRRSPHLARRLVTTALVVRASADDEAWARAHLTPPEQNLWDRQHPRDRVHAVQVARRVCGQAPTAVSEATLVTAALCHDVGKGLAGLGVAGRVTAALVEPFVDADLAWRWSWRSGWIGRIGTHLRYPELGAQVLAEGDSHPVVVAWAREHHRDPSGWTVPVEVGELLRAADDA